MQNIWEYGYWLTRILSYKDRIYDPALIQENNGQWKPIFWHILCSASYTTPRDLNFHNLSGSSQYPCKYLR